MNVEVSKIVRPPPELKIPGTRKTPSNWKRRTPRSLPPPGLKIPGSSRNHGMKGRRIHKGRGAVGGACKHEVLHLCPSVVRKAQRILGQYSLSLSLFLSLSLVRARHGATSWHKGILGEYLENTVTPASGR